MRHHFSLDAADAGRFPGRVRHLIHFVGGRGGHGPHGHHGRGPGGHGRGDFGGDDGMLRGRKFGSDDLQLLLLSLLAEAPAHGYELIRALQTRSNGFYSPSPGMVYPALTYLEEIGYATVLQEGNRKRYELADTGRQYLADNQSHVDLMFARLAHFARKMDSVRRAFSAPNDEREATEVGEDRNAWLPAFVTARRALKHALLLRSEIGPDEQKRIAAILEAATAAIETVAAPSRTGAPTQQEPE